MKKASKKSLNTDPKYKEDILEQLLHHDGCPAMIREMRLMITAVEQQLIRAADEIERLRGLKRN
jgi:hypothetical protein